MKAERFVTRLLLKVLNSAFESINMGLDQKLFLQLFVIGYCLFFSRFGIKISIEISCNLRILLR